MKWFWIILALIYIVSPYDLLPDFLPIRGWIDDAVVLSLLIWYIRRLMRYRTNPRGHEGYHQQGARSHGTGGARPAESDTTADDPYQVLGVSPDASREEIQKAYRRLAGQYHPDKVAHLGKEFQELAERRFKEIQAAYEKVAKPQR